MKTLNQVRRNKQYVVDTVNLAHLAAIQLWCNDNQLELVSIGTENDGDTWIVRTFKNGKALMDYRVVVTIDRRVDCLEAQPICL